MKIEYLKINGFGKLQNKEIQFKPGINLIYGKNEQGKTTLFKFIVSMFYGISKNKNGKEISDYEQYKPWNGEEFSGKIKYQLEDNKKYEVFREFSKKNPKIYNESLEEISNKFSIDKTKGNQFFYEQTKVEEELFLKTTMVEQKEVILDNQEQNDLVQKLANLVSSGENNISFGKAIDKLNKKLIEEVGTQRTVGRPINVIEEKIEKLKYQKQQLEKEKIQKQIIEDKRALLEQEVEQQQEKITNIKGLKGIKEKERLEKEKIKMHENLIKQYEEKIKEIKTKKLEKNTLQNNNLSILFIFSIIIAGINLIFNANKILSIGIAIILVVSYFIYIQINRKKHSKKKEEAKTQQKEIEILEENRQNQQKQIEKIKKEIQEAQNISIIEYKVKPTSITNMEWEEIEKVLEEEENKYHQKRMELNTTIIEEKNTNNKLENLINVIEELQVLEEQKKELIKLEKSIILAKDTLEKSYYIMKNTVTPKYTEKLSETIAKVTQNKYKKVVFRDKEGLLVELDNGEYISCNRLSIGTIEQMYLSLRLSAIKDITEEKMPIILDESFAYYDETRLKNSLQYLQENFKEYQVIIFTCSNREKDILEKEKILFNYIEL